MALVLIMIGIGGVTRLTRSGLSIVEWRPISGMIPPLSESHWQEQFDLYKQTPEFQKVNSDFTLGDYKRIFIWEYLHRLFGRLIFFFTFFGGLYLWTKKKLEIKIVWLLSGFIAFQGLVGWLMVKSGLNVLPRVSPYMLSLHYFMALVVLGMAYYFLSQMRPSFAVNSKQVKTLIRVVGVLLFIQIFYGNLTSGLKAGHYYGTFPLMGGQFLPPAGLGLEPLWTNFFENPVTVQWIHRWLGIITLLAVYILGYRAIKTQKKEKGPFIHLMGITTSQVILGVLNLLFNVPIALAVMHQLIAALIVLGYLNLAFRAK